MPVMDLTDENGGLRYDAPLTVLTTMLFPESLERQNELYITIMANFFESKNTDFEWGPRGSEMIKFLLHAKPLEQQSKDLRLRYLRGLMVGEVLSMICYQIQNDPATASRNKAQYLQRKELDASVEKHLKVRLPKSDRAQHESWREFSPVAHLWAALKLLVLFHDTDDSEPLGIFDCQCAFDDIPELFGVAECFRKAGEEFVPSGQRPTPKSPASTVLDPKKTWKCPEGLEIPENKVAFHFDESASQVFDQYNYAKLFGMK